MAGCHVYGRSAMVGDGMVQGPQKRTLVHYLGNFRKVFADYYARSFRVDRLEFAADFFGSIRLEIPHIDGGWPASKPHQDDPFSLGFARSDSLRFETQNIRQPQAECPRRPKFEETAAICGIGVHCISLISLCCSMIQNKLTRVH